MHNPLHGVVLHIMQGTENSSFSWFNRAGTKVSAHFGNPRHGHLEQFVSIDDVAYAQMSGNRDRISVENEGVAGQDLPNDQVNNVGALFGWLCRYRGVPFTVADTPNGFGLGYHAMGGRGWGGHSRCPGPGIIEQRLLIIERAALWRPAPQPLLV